MNLGMKARFKGSDGSLGYQVGRIYDLRVYGSTPGTFASVSRIDGSGRCPYASLDAFLRNWEPLDADNMEREA